MADNVDGQIIFQPVLAGQNAFLGSLNKLANNGGQALGKITGKASEFQKSLDASNARVIAFGASAGALFALKSGFDKLISSTIKTEQSLVEINTLLNLSREGLARFSADLFKVANSTSSSFFDAAKAAQEFSRQGLGVEATLKRTNSALILTKLSGLSLEDSVSSLTAALNGFGKEALTDIDIVNRLANVDAKFAVSSADLAEALKRVSSSASDAGVGFNQIIALVTSAQQITARGGAVIGNSLKTILTRVQRPQVLDDLAAVGVAIKDLDGKKLPLLAEDGQSSVLKNLANQYDNLSSAQKSFVSETVGGVYQINILKSLLGDLGSGFSIYDGAVQAAEQSTASAQKRIEALNNTISSQLIRTLNNLTQASAAAGNALFAPSIRGGASIIEKFSNVGTSYNSETGKDGLNPTGHIFEALGKGVGNAIAGPGIQLAIFTLVKLFGNFVKFVRESITDLTGLNTKSNERVAIEKLVVAELVKEKVILGELLAGTISLEAAQKRLLTNLNAGPAAIASARVFSGPIATNIQNNKGATRITSSSGYVPNVTKAEIYSEVLGAKRGGYNAGNVVPTLISNGNSLVSAVVNTAETRSSVEVGGKTYDFVNPPRGSLAGNLHMQNSIAKTGINPYNLGQRNFAGRFAPNLAVVPVVSKLVGRLATNLVSPMGYDLREKLTKIAAARPKDIYNALVKDQPAEYLKHPTLGLETEYGATRDFAFRSMFGLKGRPELSKYLNLDKVDEKTYSFKPGTRFHRTIFDKYERGVAVSSARDGDLIKSVIPNHHIMAKYNFTEDEKNQTMSYQDTFDIGLNGNDKQVSYKKAFGEVKEFVRAFRERQTYSDNSIETRMKRASTTFQGDDFGGEGDYRASATSNVLRHLINKITSPISFAGTEKKFTDAYSQRFPDPNDKGLISGGFVPNLAGFKYPSHQKFIKRNSRDVRSLLEGGGNVGFSSPRTQYLDVDLNKVEGGINYKGKNNFGDLLENVSNKGRYVLSGGFAPNLANIDELVAYHLSKVASPDFGDKHKTDLSSMGFHFGTESQAKFRGTQYDFKGSASLGKYSLAIKNPLEVSHMASFAPDHLAEKMMDMGFLDDKKYGKIRDRFSEEPKVGNQLVKILKKKGYDGLKYLNEREGEGYSHVPFSVNQIKKIMAGGYISDALSRENRATGGNAVLSRSSKLATSDNPLGFVAIDKRSQRNADDAIAQHMMMGQSLSQIKRQKSASGFVPNLNTDSSMFGSSMLLVGAQLLAQNLEGAGGMAKKAAGYFGSFGILLGKAGKELDTKISTDKRAIKTEVQWIEATEKARDEQLKAGKGNFAFDIPNRTLQGYRKVGAGDLEEQLGESQSKVAEFNDLVEQRKKGFRTAGFIGSIGGGIVGGAVSSLVGKSKIFGDRTSDVGAGIDEFTSGIVTGGQILATFPNKWGKFTGGIAVAAGALSAIDTISKGIEKERKAFGTASDATQKYVSEINGLINTISTMDGMFLDSTVSQATLTKTQNKYEATLAKIGASSKEGQDLAIGIRGAGSNKERIKLLADAQAKETADLEKKAVNLQIKELGADRSLIGFGTKLSGGLFGGSNEADIGRSSQILQSAASSIIASFDSKTDDASIAKKKELVDNVTNGKFSSILGGNEEFQSITKAIKEAGGGDKGVALLVDQLKLLVGQTKLNQDPNVKAAIKRQRETNERGQGNLDNEVRNKQNLQKQFINSSAFAGTSLINKSDREARGIFNTFEINETKQKGINRISSLFTDDETNKQRDLGVQADRNDEEFKRKSLDINSRANSKILGVFKQPFEELTKSFGDGITENGERAPIKPEDFAKAKALNDALVKTIEQTASSGGLVSLFDRDEPGKFGQTALNAIVSNAPNDQKDSVFKKLSSVINSTELQQGFGDRQDEIIKSLQEQGKNTKIIAEESKTIANEAKAKRGIESFGGTRLLTDPRFAAEQRRNATRAQIFSNSNDPILKGRGAALQLQLKQFAGVRIEKEGDAGLLATVATGLEKAVANFVKFSTVLGNSVGANQARTTLAEGVRGKDFAGTVNAEFKPFDPSVVANTESKLSTTALDEALAKVSASVDSFPASLTALEKSIKESVDKINAISVTNKADNNAATEEVTKALKAAAEALGNIATEQKQVTDNFSKSGTGGNAAVKYGGAAAAIAAAFVANKALFSGQAGKDQLKGGFKTISDVSKKGAGATREFLTKERGGISLNPFGSKINPKDVLTREQLREISKNTKSFKEVKVTAIPKGPMRVPIPYTPMPLSRTPMPVKVIPTPEALATRNQRLLKVLSDMEKKKPIKVGATPSVVKRDFLLARQEIQSRETFQNRTQNAGQRASMSRGLERAILFNPEKSPNPNAFDLSKIKSGGKNAIITTGIIAALTGAQSLFASNNAGGSDLVSGELEKPKSNFLGDVGKTASISVGGGIVANQFSKRVLGGKFGGPSGLKGFGLNLGIGMGDSLLDPYLAPQGEGNGALRTATSFLPPGLNVAGRAGVRAGEAINYKYGGGKLDEMTGGKNASLSSLYGQNPLLEKIRQINEYTRGDRGKQSSNIISEYRQQADFLRQNDSLKGMDADQLKPIFDALGERIDNLRKGIENESLTKEAQKESSDAPPITFPPINIEISVKDLDKLPELFGSQIIEPLEEQIRAMRDRLSKTESRAGIQPTPSAL